MGLASGQLRFLMLTSRKNDLEFNAMKISNEKTSLARDMNKVTKDYQNSLNNRRFKLSNNNGSTYSDLSYKNLMKPSLFNNYKPYFISNQQGRIVLNDEYAEIAKSLGIPQSGGVSFDELGGVDEALSKLTGIDKSKINAYYTADKNVKELQNTAFYYDGVTSYYEEIAGSTYMSADNFADSLYENFHNCKNMEDTVNQYDPGLIIWMKNTSNNNWFTFDNLMHMTTTLDATLNKSTETQMKSIVNTINIMKEQDTSAQWSELDNANKNAHILLFMIKMILCTNANRFTQDEFWALYKATEETISVFETNIWVGNATEDEINNNDHKRTHQLLAYRGNQVSTTTFRDVLIEIIKKAFNNIKNNNPSQYNYNYNLIDGDTFAYREDNFRDNISNLDKAKKKADETYKDFQEALSNKNAMLNADEESSLEFYENILRAICEKGWCENNRVNDSEYLDNMLQNNTYMMTTQAFKEGLIEYKSFEDAGYLAASKGKVAAGADAENIEIYGINAKRSEIDKMYKNGDYIPDSYTYTTRLASDFSQLFNVTDTDLQAEAEAEYTYQRNIIKQKEARLDVQLEKIKTEQSAISQMMQSIKQQMSSNIERSMNVFSA